MTKRTLTALLFVIVASAVLFALQLGPRPGPAPPLECRAPKPPRGVDRVALAPMFDGAAFDKPVQLLQHPTEPSSWFVVLHKGIVLRIADGKTKVVLDITDRVLLGDQWGLQQIALHPDFPRDGRVFISYFAHGSLSQLAMVRTRLDGERVDAASLTVLLSEAQPRTRFHPIGGLVFGPDGYLYVGWGEGGLSGEDLAMLRSRLLRIDVDGGDGDGSYAIPADNPFVGTPYRPETWALGFRNPWRFSFDSDSGQLWLGDIGEASFEEINRIEAGKDYGWPAWEGAACRDRELCAQRPTELPTFRHSHTELCAVIGGYVYRGRQIEFLRGKYVYGNGCQGALWALDIAAERPTSEVISSAVLHLASFAEDRDKELYVVSAWEVDETTRQRDYSRGRIYKIVAPAAAAAVGDAEAPQSLAALGCIAKNDPGLAAPPGMIEYALRQPPWENGADAHRFMMTRKTETDTDRNDMMLFRRGTVVMKTYVDGGKPVETQMLARVPDGSWQAYLYEWNDVATDAFPVANAERSCTRCHNSIVGMLHGLTVAQLNREFAGEDQIDRLAALDTIVSTGDTESLPKLARLDDEAVSVELRARAYLDVNCSACHQPGGESGGAKLDLRRAIPFSLTGLCDAGPNVVLTGHEDARLVAPGYPARSVLSLRMHATDLSAMPPQRTAVDRDGVALVDAWIASLRGCSTP